ncbi:MAG: ABC transporter ATP-binding protein [Euryarchaeota archaeon]|nr:ABC transporter ATP-binding protein [Euryarchaeota archaeon]
MSVIARHMAKKYAGKIWGARDIDFEAENGKITVLLGPNGAGKTTTVGLLSTLLRPTKGEALIDGYSTVREPWKVRERIALCPQDIKVDMNWTPWDAVKGYLMVRGYSREEVMERGEKYLRSMELWDVRTRPSIRLSGGQRKRIAVAMVLASGAPVIFLDEPSSGLDVEARYVVWKSLREEAKNGKVIVLTTHDMREAEMLGDQIVMISGGNSVAKGTPEELRKIIPYAYKIVVKNPENMTGRADIDFGDRKIIYAKTRDEALEIMENIKAESVALEEVTLEDVYLHVMGGENGKN